MNFLKALYTDEKGQTSTEYMVLLASVVAALLGGAYILKGQFDQGMSTMSKQVKSNLAAGFSTNTGG